MSHRETRSRSSSLEGGGEWEVMMMLLLLLLWLSLEVFMFGTIDEMGMKMMIDDVDRESNK